MSLQNPLWLLGLLAIPPVIWLAWRYKKPLHLLVSSVILWRKLPSAPTASRQRWQWLLSLICHVLFVILLVLTLAQPVVHIKSSVPRHIIVLLDNSASMSSVISGTNKTRWDIVKNKLEILLNQLNTNDRVTIWHSQGSIREVDKQSALKDLAQIPLAMIAHNFNGFIRQVASAINTASKQEQITLVICLDKMPPDEVIGLLPVKPLFVLVGEPSNNKAIVQANSTPAPDKPSLVDIFVMVKNYSGSPVEFPVELSDTKNKPVSSIKTTVPAGSKCPIVFPAIPADPGKYRVSIKINDELPADNEAWVRAGEDKLRLCLTGINNEAVLKVLRAIGNTASVDYTPVISDTTKYDLLIFNNALPEILPQHSVIINPPVNINAMAGLKPLVMVAGVITPMRITIIDEASPLFRHISFDNIHIRQAAQLVIYDREHFKPLVKSGDDVLIGEFRDGEKYCLVIGFDVEWNKDSNWSLMPSFPIFWANVINYFNSQIAPKATSWEDASNLCDEAESDNSGEMRDDTAQLLKDETTKELSPVNISAYFIIAAGCLLILGWLIESRTI